MPSEQTYTVLPRIMGSLAQKAWSWYRVTFAEINRHAALRHLMTLDEFMGVMFNPLIDKHILVDASGEIVALGVCTNQLYAWPLVSPEYFEYHWPEHYAEKRIWFVGFIGAGKDASRMAFRTILRGMQDGVADNMWFMDMCTVNKDRVEMAARFHLQGINKHMSIHTVDQQSFVQMRFDATEEQ